MKIKGILTNFTMEAGLHHDGPKISFTVYLEGFDKPTSFVDIPFSEDLANNLAKAKKSGGEVDFEL